MGTQKQRLRCTRRPAKTITACYVVAANLGLAVTQGESTFGCQELVHLIPTGMQSNWHCSFWLALSHTARLDELILDKQKRRRVSRQVGKHCLTSRPLMRLAGLGYLSARGCLLIRPILLNELQGTKLLDCLIKNLGVVGPFWEFCWGFRDPGTVLDL